METEFDPIKLQKDGKCAEKVVWSTSVLEKAINALSQGLQLKANPFIGKNTKLLKPDLVFKRTQEEVDDYIRCMNDPIYFASKCYLMTPIGLKPVVLRDYQEDYIRHLQEHRFSCMISCRQAGKSTTTAIYCLWSIIFRIDRQGLLLSKSGPAGRELLAKIKDMYMYLPYHLKPGVLKWNQSEISFDNNSSIVTEPFSPTAGLGKTINFLVLDEFAWCPPNEVELFYNNIIPTVTADTTSNICIISTQNGYNLFYRLYTAAEKGENIYAPFKVDWWQVPQWNNETKTWDKRTEEWKQQMIGTLGSEEAFYYQYGTMFSASDKCIVSRECLSELRNKARMFIPLSKHVVYSENLLYYSLNSQYFRIKEDYVFDKSKNYVVFIDLAEGCGGDFTVFNILEILDSGKYEQVGYWHSNKVELKYAALEFWFMFVQVFDIDKVLVSIEWNTYGALFYQFLLGLNEQDFDTFDNSRFNVSNEGVDTTCIVKYPHKSLIDGKPQKSTIPGIKMTSSNKPFACTMLKMMLEQKNVTITDTKTIIEIEQFEQIGGSGTYAASQGHDDIIMTFVQLPLLEQTPRFKFFIDDMKTPEISTSHFSNLYV